MFTFLVYVLPLVYLGYFCVTDHLENVKRKEYNEWICFEHTGYPRQKAEQWWMKRVVGVQIVPKNVKDAMDRKDFIKKPSHIRVRPDGKYFSIVGYKFE